MSEELKQIIETVKAKESIRPDRIEITGDILIIKDERMKYNLYIPIHEIMNEILYELRDI